ncbi:FadR/GntR family transcriptional regulator [Salinibacterium sp. ZJ450]|uniref:FadR/GntR family transcriptional regulator n=1 Tax=Salinibacterium sp. ZJ450 TaxID=2708338 RepID=UPI00141E9ED4|nr:FCD domain-containing protein [Salinibacterium sp. ZJ450]
MTDALLSALLRLIEEVGPGGRIPPERELAELVGASRTAIRSRLRELESAGALERRGSAGTFARTMAPSDVAQALRLGLSASPLGGGEAFQTIRVALERQAAKGAAESASPVPIAYAEEAVLRMESTTDPDELYEADLAFHRSLFHASGDDALIFFSEAIGDLLKASVTARRQRMLALATDIDEMRALHRVILDAVKSRDPVAAMAAMDRHFEHIDSLTATENVPTPQSVDTTA